MMQKSKSQIEEQKLASLSDAEIEQRILNMKLDEIQKDYKPDLSKLKDNQEFFFLVQVFVDYFIIDVEAVIDLYLKFSLDECFERLGAFLD